MDDARIRTVVIVGGGTAGWMSAAVLAKLMQGRVRVRLVESDEIGIVGVGEATIPQIRLFNATLGLDEDEFLRRTQGTFKLGIEFAGWTREGERYMHAFGPIGGRDLGLVQFHQYWLKLRAVGRADELGRYVFNDVAARAGRFMRGTGQPNSPLTSVAHAFHFDAGLYARHLRAFAERLGVERTEGRVVDVRLREDGFVGAVLLDGGAEIDGDLFVDCSGFRALVIGAALRVGYDDWTRWLPCDRALAVPCASAPELLPYTRATARAAGWQWRIPLQHRIGNGYVYSSAHLDDDAARRTLLAHLDGEALAEPRQLRFTTGVRRRFWERNCVALGLSSGFLEPLESTSIHFIQSGLSRLVALFPDRGFASEAIDEYNRQTLFEYERARDFLVLHYLANARAEPFWRERREATIPDSLRRRLDLFHACGRVFRENEELFAEGSWMQVLLGQGLRPERWHPMVDLLDDAEAVSMLEGTRALLERAAAAMPAHADFIARHCAAATAD